MFQRLQNILQLNTSEPLAVARAANSAKATVVCLDADGAKWMQAKGCKTITIADLEADEFDPNSIDPKTPIIFTTKALKAIADNGQYLREEVDQLRVQLAREEDRHLKTKEDLTKRAQVMEANRDAAKYDLESAKERIKELLARNVSLVHELSEARRPWWSKLFGKGGSKP